MICELIAIAGFILVMAQILWTFPLIGVHPLDAIPAHA
jgi:hypothetical protein